MELGTMNMEDSETGEHAVLERRPWVGPLENPKVPAIPNDPLLEPHPHEPGVSGGAAAPLENPG
jgi:hypothetical protein